jgi:hypothetical protein
VQHFPLTTRLVALSLVLCTGVAVEADDSDPREVFFRDKVRPILQLCVNCHHDDSPQGELNLTTRAGALKGGEHGPALKPGDAAASMLFKMTSTGKMPPKKPLSDAQVATLKHWIDNGALWQGTITKGSRVVAETGKAGLDWWSLQPLRRPDLPLVKRREWVRNPIDAFILAGLEKQALTPTSPAERAVLLRRVTFDLHGLPPTAAEIDAFVNDRSGDAWEKVIGRLLASPRYGERWGRHWLDVARFGESQGFERDKLRDNSWPYRDYVIRAFNEDKPFPQFIREQIAGDVLQPASPDGIVATGFLVAGPWDEVGHGSVSPQVRVRTREEELEDMVGTVAQTFLGLTANCARCHNHKFDPIPQKDYYRLKAVFEGVRPGDRPILTPEQVRQREAESGALTKKIAELEKELAALEDVGRVKLGKTRGEGVVKGLPTPLARWTFQDGPRDTLGAMHGTLQGGATIVNGRLRLNGKDAFLRTAPLSKPVREKTLEAWVSLANLTQRGGSILTLESRDGIVFDGIVFGERQPGKWIAGSTGFQRTRDLSGEAETGKPTDLVHLAIVYAADDSIAVYRNGAPYAPPYVPGTGEAALRTYPAGEGRVLIGMRHTGGGSPYFAGEIAEARLYDRALTPAEVSASFRAGLNRVPLEEILIALTAEQRLQHKGLREDLDRRRTALKPLAGGQLVYAANPTTPGPTHVLTRGDPDKKAEQVSAGGLSALKTLPADFGLGFDAPEAARRRGFADWLAHPDNPLPARVMVNRIWHYHFGKGLVASPNDFGFNGARPTHTELLDWLAVEFRERGWSVKQLHRLILLSATYQQSSKPNDKAAAVDADNHLLWRFSPRRLEGEAVRDAMLFVSGQLNEERGGPSFRPFTVQVFNSNFYTLTDPIGPEYNRRTVYRMNVNSAKNPLLDAFDCPDPSTKTPRRSVTTTPLQALGLMNNSFILRQAKYFSERVRKEAGDEGARQLTMAYRMALGRSPNEKEATRAGALVKEHGLEQLCWVLFNATEFLYLR